MLKKRLRVGVTVLALVLSLAVALPGHAASAAPLPASHGAWASFLDGLHQGFASLLGLGPAPGSHVTPGAGRHAPAPQATTQSGGGNTTNPNSSVGMDPNG